VAPQPDLVVVGAGHAGCEAALGAARMGARVVVVTLRRDTVAQMPCNPAMGGIGKGHLMAEIDALGGVQAWAADRAGLQFRVLNRSRGAAVWGPRVQCDKARYSLLMLRLLERARNISLIEGEAVGLIGGGGRIEGLRLGDGRRVTGRAVLLTTGTFLGGLLHTGDERRDGGRFGEPASHGLGRDLAGLGLELRRYKTGTPPRLHRDSLDYARLREQRGDESPLPFSWRTREVRNRVSCWVTRTPPLVRTIVNENLDRSPLYSGRIAGTGPRYCPSIEDKVVRFPDHEEHTVFLEPEGLTTPSVYVNGLSTSLPRDVQERIVHAVPGLERACFLRHGYAVEYDVVAAVQVGRTLRVRGLDNLYLAGQVLGTSGYEEAAAQGLLAGVNAILEGRSREPLCLGREEAYIGVLIDDLITRDHREPYRMMTSRAEHRLLLGVDSARERLMARGVALGLVPERAFHVERRRWKARDRVAAALESERVNSDNETAAALLDLAGVDLRRATTWAALLRRPDLEAGAVAARIPGLAELSDEDRSVVVSRLRYAGYLERHQRERERVRRLRARRIPETLLAGGAPGLSREVAELLAHHQPATLADAEQLPGMTPAAMAILAGRVASEGRKTGAGGDPGG